MKLLILPILLLACGCASTHRGTAVATDRPTDFAIDGEGFFIVESGSGGYLFTRTGNLYIDTNRYLVTADGYKLAPPVQVPDQVGDLRVTLDGKLQFISGRDVIPCGQIRLAMFANSSGLDSDGGYLLPTSSSGDPVTQTPGSAGAGTIKSRMLEK